MDAQNVCRTSDSTDMSQNQYLLMVSELNEPSHNYTVTIELYKFTNEEKPIQKFGGGYNGQSTTGIAGMFSRLIKSFLG